MTDNLERGIIKVESNIQGEEESSSSSSTRAGADAPEETPQQQPAAAEPTPSTSASAIQQQQQQQQQQQSVERQTSSTSEGSSSSRRFPFLVEFDSGPGAEPRHIQALNMIQEWARNSMVNATIPMLGNSNSGSGPEQGGTSRPMSTQRQQSADTQINIPGGDLPLGPLASNPALSLPSRLARGLLSSSNFRRRSEDIPDIPVTYNQASSNVGVGAGNRDRASLTLDLEGAAGGASADENGGNAAENEGSGRASTEAQPNSATGGGTAAEGRRSSPTGSAAAAGTPNRGASGEGTPTAPSDILRDSPETRAFIEEINQYTTLRPFLILMLLKSLVDHGSGIVCFLALIVTFSHANSLLKKEISKQRKRNLLFLAMIVVNLIGCAAFIYYVFSDEELYFALGFMSTRVDLATFLMLMWVIGVTDYIAKFGAIVAKAFIVAMPTAMIPFQKRGIYYLFIEQTSQLYRSALPCHHWLLYLINSYDGSMKMFGLILAGMYIFFKLLDSVQRVKDWQSAFRKLFQNVHYGTTLTAKELDSMDSVCPICHDTFTAPTRLSCSHVFCEECVSTWFDRGMTCPMCRAKVVDDPSFRDGTTAQYIQFF